MTINNKLKFVPAIAKSVNPKNAIAAVRSAREEKRAREAQHLYGLAHIRAIDRFNDLDAIGTFTDWSAEQMTDLISDLVEAEMLMN